MFPSIVNEDPISHNPLCSAWLFYSSQWLTCLCTNHHSAQSAEADLKRHFWDICSQMTAYKRGSTRWHKLIETEIRRENFRAKFTRATKDEENVEHNHKDSSSELCECHILIDYVSDLWLLERKETLSMNNRVFFLLI